MSCIVPVSELQIGQRVRLVRIAGGQQLQRRLLALGLALGSEAELVQRRGGGVVLGRGANRVALGQGVAHRVYGEVLE